MYQYDRIKDRYRWTFFRSIDKKLKVQFLTKITERLSSVLFANTPSVFLNLFSKLLSIFAFTPTLFGARYSSALITKNSDSFSFKEDNDRALSQNTFLQGINEYIWSLSSQSQCAFTAIHCLPYAKTFRLRWACFLC